MGETGADEAYLGRRLETMAAEEAFDQVVDVAANVCLRNPDLYLHYLDTLKDMRTENSESQLVRQLGVRGLSAALEITAYGRSVVAPAREAEGTRCDAVTHPERFSDSVDPDIACKIEAFGWAILIEAFDCLGEDAPDKVTEFKEAQTKQQQLEVLEWLDERVVAIRDKQAATPAPAEEPAEEGVWEGYDGAFVIQDLPAVVVRERITEPTTDSGVVREVLDFSEPNEYREPEFFYHPARLSPRLIGEFPHTRL